MRSLPAGLAAAIGSSPQGPRISITSQDLLTRLTPWLNTASSPGRSAALLIPLTGSVIRGVIATGTTTLLLYRVDGSTITTPTPWQAAARAAYTNALQSAGCALVQTGSTIRVFWCDATSKHIFYADSTNDGQNWGAAVDTAIAPPLTNNLCHGIAATDTSHIYVAYADFDQSADAIYALVQTAGVWGAWSSVGPASPTWGRIRGLMCDTLKPASPALFAAGVQMRTQLSGDAASVATLSAGVWSPFTSIEDNDAPSNGLSRAYPTLHYDSNTARYYAAVTLADDGSVSGQAKNRTNIWSSADGLTWSIICPTAYYPVYSVTGEVHVILASGYTFVFDAYLVWMYPGPPAATDLSPDILSLHIAETANDHTRFTITLANQNAQYTALPNLRDNAKLHIAFGLAGYTLVDSWDAYIDAVSYQAAGNTILAIIHARGPTKITDQNSQRLLTIPANTVAQLATQLATLAGVTLASLPGTAQFSQVVPCFVVAQGESWWQALKRLSNLYDFDITAASPASLATPPTLKLTERQASDPSTWTYAQEILASTRQQNADQPNIIRVVGGTSGTANVFAEATDYLNMNASGAHRYQHIVDRMLDTSAKCQIKANLALRAAQTELTTGSATVTANPQLELLDVITLTDSRTGYTATAMRIMAIDTIIDFHSGQWEQRLELNVP